MSVQNKSRIAELRRKIAKKEENLGWAESRTERLSEWSERVRQVEETNMVTREKLAIKEKMSKDLRIAGESFTEGVEAAKELGGLHQELLWLDSRREEVMSQIARKIQKIKSVEFDSERTETLRADCDLVGSSLKKEWDIPEDEWGRRSLDLCSDAMRRKYWELDILRSRSRGGGDPYHPSNKYNERDFVSMVRRHGWK
tara:strand:- start:396 stop:992 length:597 start_codon:yes stop_codon:yes gene_type:complete